MSEVVTSAGLFSQMREWAIEAKQLAIDGEVEEAEGLLAKVDELQPQAEALKRAEDQAGLFDRVDRDLPFADNTDDAEDNESGEQVDPAVKAVYSIRFGSDEAAVQAVLKDLYGSDYMHKRVRQQDAFVKYLRDYNHEPKGEDHALLKTVLVTPDLALKAVKQGLSVKYMKAASEGIDEYGGYAVPIDFQTEVIRRIQGVTVMRGRARTMTTSRDRVELPKLTGGDDQYPTAVRITWVDETPTAGTADTTPTWGTEPIDVETMMAETFLSRNLVEDAAFDLVAELTMSFGEGSGIDEDNRFLVGDGIGKPKGLLVDGDTVPTGMTEVNSGNASTLTWDGLIGLSYGIAAQYRRNAVWIMERATASAIRKMKDGMGRYLWEPNQQAGQPANLLGFPVLEQEIMPTIGAGTYPILFGDPQGYRIVDRVGMTVERYLDSATARINSVVYVMRRRLGGKLVEPWRWAVQKVSA